MKIYLTLFGILRSMVEFLLIKFREFHFKTNNREQEVDWRDETDVAIPR